MSDTDHWEWPSVYIINRLHHQWWLEEMDHIIIIIHPSLSLSPPCLPSLSLPPSLPALNTTPGRPRIAATIVSVLSLGAAATVSHWTQLYN